MLFGGLDSNDVPKDWTFEYGENDTWETKSPTTKPSARYEHALAFDNGVGTIILFGGRQDDPNELLLNDTWAWNGTNWQNLSPATSPPRRWKHSMGYDLGDDELVMFGGEDEVGDVLGDTWIWDGTTWTEITQFGSQEQPTPRKDHAIAYDATFDRIVMYGGRDSTNQLLNDTWLFYYDDVNDVYKWEQHVAGLNESVPPPRADHAMAFSGRVGAVLFWG